MVTINQRIRAKKRRIISVSKSPILEGNPHRMGICKAIFTKKPKKPNSANRRVASIVLNTGLIITCAIRGRGHNLQEHGFVLLRGGRIKDVPGVNYTLVRGKFDLGAVLFRKRARSKYGVKKPRKSR